MRKPTELHIFARAFTKMAAPDASLGLTPWTDMLRGKVHLTYDDAYGLAKSFSLTTVRREIHTKEDIVYSVSVFR